MVLQQRLGHPSSDPGTGHNCRLQQALQLLGLADQRLSPRSPCSLAVRYAPLGHRFTSREGTVVDVSSRGLGIFTHKPLCPGTWIVLDLDSGEGPVLARVVHSRAEERGWRSGLELARPCPPDDEA